MDTRVGTIQERVVQKCEALIDRVEFIEAHFSEEVLTERILRKAMYKEFQEAVEAAATSAPWCGAAWIRRHRTTTATLTTWSNGRLSRQVSADP